jgi:5'-deoxynucleotidase YfbR-like HD superfamily hydrolase
METVRDWKPLLEAASSDIRRLDYVTRYSSIPVTVPENDSTHMYWVSIYSMMVHRRLNGPKELDALIMQHALTHDALECLSGDIVRTFKYSSDEFRAAVNRAEQGLASSLPLEIRSLLNEVHLHITSFGHTHHWKGDYVKDVVKAADFMSLYQYMWREKKRGNSEIDPFFGRMIEDLTAMAKKLNDAAGPKPREFDHRPSLAILYRSMAEGFAQRFTV